MIAFVAVQRARAVAIAWPLVLGVPHRTTEAQAHAGDAPVLVAMFVPLLILVAIDAAQGRAAATRD